MNKLTAKYIQQIHKLEDDIIRKKFDYHQITVDLLQKFLAENDHENIVSVNSDFLLATAYRANQILEVMHFEKFPDDCRAWRQFINILEKWKEEQEQESANQPFTISEVKDGYSNEHPELLDQNFCSELVESVKPETVNSETLQFTADAEEFIKTENGPGLSIGLNIDELKTIYWPSEPRTLFKENEEINILSESEYNKFVTQLEQDFPDLKRFDELVSPATNVWQCTVYKTPENITHKFNYHRSIN